MSSSEDKVAEEEKSVVSILTEEQKAFLEECERDFANRYTPEEEDFHINFEKEPSSPPILYPWGRSHHNNRYSRGNYSRNYDQRNRYHDRVRSNRDHYDSRNRQNDNWRRNDGGFKGDQRYHPYY